MLLKAPDKDHKYSTFNVAVCVDGKFGAITKESLALIEVKKTEGKSIEVLANIPGFIFDDGETPLMDTFTFDHTGPVPNYAVYEGLVVKNSLTVLVPA